MDVWYVSARLIMFIMKQGIQESLCIVYAASLYSINSYHWNTLKASSHLLWDNVLQII